ncbi:MAG TPA: protein translocase subunit SecD [Phycisphaerae bacterium]|nr:protein translocase subunit SecD [Phycisphaerae bacterium]
MERQNRVLMWLIVLVPLVWAVLRIIPPEDRLKGGIDLVGGCSLLYEIDTAGLAPQDIRGLSEKVMRVLQRRVDPNAQLNLVWRPVGNTRLEVQMPRPPKKAQDRRREKDAATAKLTARNVGRREVELVLSSDAATRVQRLDELVRGVTERRPKLTALQETYDAYLAVKGGEDVDAEENARVAYEAAFGEVLATSLAPARLEDVFAIKETKQRSEQVGKLKTEHASYADLISEIEQKYDVWAAQKAALEDPSDLKRLLRGAGVLEFRILADRDATNPTMIAAPEGSTAQPIGTYSEQLQTRGSRPRTGDAYRWFPVEDPVAFLNLDRAENLEQVVQTGKQILEEYAGTWYVLAHNTSRYGLLRDARRKWKLKAARADRDESGRPAVSFTLDPRGGAQFHTMTRENIGRQLCIMLDDMAMSQAVIRSAIREYGQISGNFTPAETQFLVNTLEAGSLPGRLKDTPLMEKNIGPSLGRTNRELGMKAALYGLIAVAIFIVIYYLFAGLVANVALILNLIFVLGIMATLEATFTLPGVAGLILTVGMAVDANVLIFERIREERAKGVIFKRALKTGYEKALSTIVDANLTTLITCVVLGYVGSEEVKGFAMVLGFGIVTSMFTALFVTRLIFTTLMDLGWLKDLRMLRLIGHPNIDWLRLRTKFWPISLALVIVGLALFAVASEVDQASIYDIEFLGGTSVQIQLKEGVHMTDEEVRRRITSSGDKADASAMAWLQRAADDLRQADVSIGNTVNQFVVASDTLTSAQIAALMQTKGRNQRDALVDRLETGGVTIEANLCRFETKLVQESKPAADETDEEEITSERSMTLQEFQQARDAAVDYAEKAAGLLATARVQTVSEIEEEGAGAQGRFDTFEIITVETNKQLVQEAVLAAFGDRLDVEGRIAFAVVTDDRHPEGYFPITEQAHYLSDAIDTDAGFDVRRYKGGVVLVFDQLDPPQRIEDIKKRIKEIRLQPGYEQYKWREYAVFGLQSTGQATAGNETFTKVAMAVVDEQLPYYDDPEGRWTEAVAAPELEQATEALSAEKTLRKVIQFAPQIAEQTKTQAIMAVAVALIAIVAYVWLRFGTMQYGLAAIVALVHDVAITLGVITVTDYFHSGVIGRLLLLQDFKIDLPMIAAMLTIIGYSLNDTIVVFDRIRENRGKLPTLNAQMINSSINQTLSRTLLTSLTTLLVVFIMYVFGGPGVHGFAFALLLGVIVGTYSSVGVAAPLLYRPRLLHIVVYVLVALGLFGGIAVVASGSPTALIIAGVILAAALVWGIRVELRSDRDYSRLVAATG